MTLARAMELKHKNSLVSSLSAETSKMFIVAGGCISVLQRHVNSKFCVVDSSVLTNIRMVD